MSYTPIHTLHLPYKINYAYKFSSDIGQLSGSEMPLSFFCFRSPTILRNSPPSKS